MSIRYSIAVKNARLDTVKDAIDAGLDVGRLDVYTAGYAVLLVSFILLKPCAYVAGGVFTLLGSPISSNGIAAGKAMIARFVDSSSNIVADEITVGMSGAMFIMDNDNVDIGQQIKLLSGIITHA